MFYERTKVYATILISAMLLISCSGDFGGDEGKVIPAPESIKEPGNISETIELDNEISLVINDVSIRSTNGTILQVLSPEEVSYEVINTDELFFETYNETFQVFEMAHNRDPILDTDLRLYFSEGLKQKILDTAKADSLISDDKANEDSIDDLPTRGAWWKKKWYHVIYIDYRQKVCENFKAWGSFDSQIIGYFIAGGRSPRAVHRHRCGKHSSDY